MSHNISYYIKERAVLTLIAVNVVMFVVSGLVRAVGDSDVMSVNFGLAGRVEVLWRHPWTLLTYMFTQWNVLHLVFNMLWLWMFGRIGRLAVGHQPSRHIYAAYLYGGLMAAVVFEVVSLVFPRYGAPLLVGSSGAVVSVMIYIAMQSPRAEVNLMLFGPARLMAVALVSVGICLMSDFSTNVATGIAHLGGMLGGVLYALWTKRRAHRKPRTRFTSDTQELDHILDKVKRTGYTGLNAHERRRLFDLSKRL